ncbi:MAG: response regulator, partial [Verrucomicrobiota bacterium]
TQALAQAVAWNPDVVLLDIQMPHLDGLEVCHRIREMPDPRRAQVPILALTALAMPGDRERCLAAGVTDYLTKPFSLRELAGVLRKMATPGQSAAG